MTSTMAVIIFIAGVIVGAHYDNRLRKALKKLARKFT